MADVGNNIFLPLAAALARGLSPLVRLPRKVDLALSLLSVALAVPALHAFEVPEKALELEKRLGLTSLAGSTELHGWACPSKITVSNQVFTLERIKSFDNLSHAFDLDGQDGKTAAECRIGICPSFKFAIDAVSAAVYASSKYNDLGPVALEEFVHFCRTEWDAKGNVILEINHKHAPEYIEGRSVLYAIYGNLALEVKVRLGRWTMFRARDFVLPLINGGLQELAQEQRKVLCQMGSPKNKWLRWIGCGVAAVVLVAFTFFVFTKSRKGERT